MFTIKLPGAPTIEIQTGSYTISLVTGDSTSTWPTYDQNPLAPVKEIVIPKEAYRE